MVLVFVAVLLLMLPVVALNIVHGSTSKMAVIVVATAVFVLVLSLSGHCRTLEILTASAWYVRTGIYHS